MPGNLFIEGAYCKKKNRYVDNRGFLMELFREFPNKQVNVSHSLPNVIRGIHAASYGKLLTCIHGSLTDYVVDLRPDSPTFLAWACVKLELNDQLYIPAHCGHAFLSGSNGCTFVYAQEEVYSLEESKYYAWNDKIVSIPWPIQETPFIISNIDKQSPSVSSLYPELNLKPRSKVLIIGASGQLGQSLVKIFGDEERKKNFLCIGTYFRHKRDGCSQQLDMESLDEMKAEFILGSIRPLVVYICSALASADVCEIEKEKATKINTEGPMWIAKAANKVGSKVVYLSSDYVFDGQSSSYKESDTPHPINVYGKTKLDGENAVMRETSNNALIIRTHGIFGPDAGKKNFVYQVAEGRRNSVPCDQTGNPIDSRDLSEALFQLGTCLNVSGIVHVAGDTLYTRYQFALDILKYLNIESKVIPIKTSNNEGTPRPILNGLDNSKFHSLLPNFKFRSLKQSFSDWSPLE